MQSPKMEADRSITATAGFDRNAAKTRIHPGRTPGERKANRVAADSVWQRRLLPFMVAVLSGLTLFFFVASLVQINYLQSRIGRVPELDLNAALVRFDESASSAGNKRLLDYARWKTLSALEANALQRRYHQGSVLLMSRVWIQYLGFVTGMTLAMVGAAFILGKLKESGSNLKLDGPVWKAALSTSSPGLMLTLMGTGLMITAMVIHNDIVVNDGATYTTQWSTVADIPKPPSLGVDGPAQASEPQAPEEPFVQQKSGDAGSRSGGLARPVPEGPSLSPRSTSKVSKKPN